MLTKMGLAAAATVALAVLIALTLIPALLGFAGPKVLTRKTRKGRVPAGDKPNVGTRWARLVVRRRVPFLLAGVVALGLAAIPMSRMELGLPDDGSQPVGTTQRKAYDICPTASAPASTVRSWWWSTRRTATTRGRRRSR